MSRESGETRTPPLSGALSLMSLNINGFRTKIKKGNKMEKKYRELGRHLLTKDLDLAAVQEPHLHCHIGKVGECIEVKEFFANIGYDLLTNSLSEGRGGAALVWNKSRWQLQRAWSLGAVHACPCYAQLKWIVDLCNLSPFLP